MGLIVPRQRSIKKPVAVSIVLLVLIGGVAVLTYRHFNSADTTNPTAQTKPITSPAGQPNNAGDNAKSSVGSPAPAPSTSPVNTPTPAATPLSVTHMTITPQGDSAGTIRVANTVTGTSSATCALTLTSPSAITRSVTGSLLYSGSSYFCSFGSITGINEKGTYTARLTAATTSTSAYADTSFKVIGN